jgi:hypothetical protein
LALTGPKPAEGSDQPGDAGEESAPPAGDGAAAPDGSDADAEATDTSGPEGGSAPDDVAELLVQWDAAADRTAKAALLETLDPDLRERLLRRLKERTAREADRDNLLDPFKDFL